MYPPAFRFRSFLTLMHSPIAARLHTSISRWLAVPYPRIRIDPRDWASLDAIVAVANACIQQVEDISIWQLQVALNI